MTVQPKHTPTPWRVHDGYGARIGPHNTGIDIGPSGRAVAVVVGKFDNATPGAEAHANARHIVHCVNVHDELVATLEEMVRVSDAHKCVCGPESPADHWGQCPQWFGGKARSILARVKAVSQ